MSIFHQERFQGKNLKSNRKEYFEGYYFRCVSRDGKSFVAIPGISSSRGKSKAFIQIIDEENKSSYNVYQREAFEYANNGMLINIGRNSFSKQGIRLKIHENRTVKGKVYFYNIKEYPKSVYTPGIMGPYSYVPFLECRHEVIIVACDLKGEIEIDGRIINFDGGKGYVEKDFGTSFPSDYLWTETNTFERNSAAFMLSAAVVPVGGRSIRGLLSYLYFDDKFYRFATYYGDSIRTIYNVANRTEIEVLSKKRTMRIKIEHDESDILKAPKKGEMSREIRECMGATTEIELFEEERQIFSGRGTSSAFEVSGNTLNL